MGYHEDKMQRQLEDASKNKITEAEMDVIDAAIALYQGNGGLPALNAGRKLDAAVEALLKERGQ